MDVKKIVRLTPGQYEELLRNGQVEVDGIVKKKEDGTLYDVGDLRMLEFFNELKEAQVTEYKVNHTPMAMKSLEQEYEELTTPVIEGGITVEAEKVSKDYSAVGYTAILQKGDTIKVTSPNSGDFYVNGERLTHDYTYTGEGYEVVNVWAFEGKSVDIIGPPVLKDEPTFDIIMLNVKRLGQEPELGGGYINYTPVIKTHKFAISGIVTRKIITNGSVDFRGAVFPTTIEEVESDCTNFTQGGLFNGRNNLKKLSLPEVETITGHASAFLYGCKSPYLEVYFPKLRHIQSTNSTAHAFQDVFNVILPPSVRNVGSCVCKNNKSIILNCNRAEFNPLWCGSTPSDNFNMCDDWRSGINISLAAAQQTQAWFIDLFENKLHDFYADYKDIIDDPSHVGEIPLPLTITIPRDAFELLIGTDEGHTAVKAAEDKYWQVEFA